MALVAVTVKVYEVPLLSPDTTTDVDPAPAGVDACAVEPTNGVTTNPVIGLPPFAGGTQLTVAEPTPALADTPLGAAGTVAGGAGVTTFDAADDGPVPTAFVAATLNVYAVPFTKPDTNTDVAPAPAGVDACAVEPTNGVTTYPVIGLPPFAGATQLTVADPSPATAVGAAGAAGTVAAATGVTTFDAADDGPVPTAFVAATLNVYAVPFTKPDTNTDVAPAPAGVDACAVEPTNGVTTYPVIGLPPLAGATQLTVADPSPATAVGAAGASGAVGGAVGTTGLEATDGGPSPTALLAVTVNVYAVPLLSPVTVVDVAVGATWTGARSVVPTNGVTEYPVIGLPPSPGAVHDTVAEPTPATAATPVGAPGTDATDEGVTELDAADGGPAPTALLAVTWNVYAVPLVSPETTEDVAPADAGVDGWATVPTNGVTTYPVIGLPPFAGAVQLTVADALPATAVGAAGAAGTVAAATGVTTFDAADDGPVPTAFVAATLNVYAVPFTKPDTNTDVAPAPAGVDACAVEPTNGVTTYPVIGLPPFAGATQLTVADPSPATAVGAAGAAGTVAAATGVTTFDAADDGPVPTAFVAATLNVYAVPFTKPDTNTDVAPAPAGVDACAVEPTNGVTTYPVIGLPPLAGATQLTVADAFPATADTPLGAAGTVADALGAAVLKTTVPMSQSVLAPVPTVAFDVAPWASSWSSVSDSMSPAGDTLVRTVKPAPLVKALPNPEST